MVNKSVTAQEWSKYLNTLYPNKIGFPEARDARQVIQSGTINQEGKLVFPAISATGITQVDVAGDSLGGLQVIERSYAMEQQVDATAPVTIQILPPGAQIWEIVAATAWLLADANAANRDLSVEIGSLIGSVAPAATPMWESQLIRITANNFGAFMFQRSGGGGYYSVNTNATLTRSTEADNPFPTVIGPDDYVAVSTLLGAATDDMGIRVYYRRIA